MGNSEALGREGKNWVDRIGFIIPVPATHGSWLCMLAVGAIISIYAIIPMVYASIEGLAPPRHGSRDSPGPLLATVYPMTSVLRLVYFLPAHGSELPKKP